MGKLFSKSPGVIKYGGFKEHAYRLLFPYEDKFPNASPYLLTILPNLVIENTKCLIPEQERGLIAYTFGQQIDENKYKLKGKVVESDQDSPWKGKEYTQTPFIKKVGNQYSLVQTWPTTINEKFKQEFAMTETNPDPKKFESSAVADYKECMQALFGPDATKKVPIQYCHKTTNNTNPCYCGMTEDLLLYLKNNKEAMSNLGIKEMTKNGFLATGQDGKGNKVEKPFDLNPNTEYVIYKKIGWETMGCCKTKEQFDKECEFLGKGKHLKLPVSEAT